MDSPNDFLLHKDNWIDVFENREEYEFLFDLPKEDDLMKIQIKDLVKISNGRERFFVSVTEIRNDCMIGIVNNHLKGQYDYVYGDSVCFEKRHIFSILKNEETQNKKINRNTVRMMKMLGIDPKKSTREAMMFDSIQNK